MFGFENTREFMEMSPEEQAALIADMIAIYEEEEEDRAQEKAYADLLALYRELDG